jgi:ribosomal protein L40E
MAKGSLGYVELEWVCPFCGGRNPGRVKVCGNCGAAQPKDVQFQQAAQNVIVTDAEALESIKVGPDIHCPFCGTRNPGNAATCSRCGGDLTDAEKREAGQVLGAAEDKAETLTCQYCGTENAATALKCKNCGAALAVPSPAVEAAPIAAGSRSAGLNPMIILGAVAALVLCGVLAFFMFRTAQTDTQTGTVVDSFWERSIVILAPIPSQRQAWDEQVPRDAFNVSCTERARGRSQFPTQNSEEVCGTPYIVDQGTGFGEMVQDCEYIVYDDFCTFTVIALLPLRTVVETGRDANPRWPQPQLAADQQLGQRNERYQIVFDVDGRQYTVTTSKLDEYRRYQLGTEWQLEINGFGNVVSIEPTS